jgi:hypothetical protein
MIVLTAEQCSRVWLRDEYPGSQLLPLLLSDGRYGVPDRVLTDPHHAHVRSVLAQGTIVADNTVTVLPYSQQGYYLTVDGKKMHVGFASGFNPVRGWPYPHHGPFTVAGTNLYRFEARYNDDHLSYDWGTDQNGDGIIDTGPRRRVEIAQGDDTGPKMGQTWWTSWSMVFTDKSAPILLGDNGTLVHQWFHTGNGPFVYVATGAGYLQFATRTLTEDYFSHYSQPFTPTVGTPQNFVMRGVLNSKANGGHLDVWLNGVQVVNVDTTVGFFDVPNPDDPAYLHIATGIYQGNVTDRAVLYLANLEFGTTDLSARITTPLPVTPPPGGWNVSSADLIYSDAATVPGDAAVDPAEAPVADAVADEPVEPKTTKK